MNIVRNEIGNTIVVHLGEEIVFYCKSHFGTIQLAAITNRQGN